MQEACVWSLVGKVPWRRKWQPTPALLPGESHGQRSLVGYSPRGGKESDTTQRLHFTSVIYGIIICLTQQIDTGHVSQAKKFESREEGQPGRSWSLARESEIFKVRGQTLTLVGTVGGAILRRLLRGGDNKRGLGRGRTNSRGKKCLVDAIQWGRMRPPPQESPVTFFLCKLHACL